MLVKSELRIEHENCVNSIRSIRSLSLVRTSGILCLAAERYAVVLSAVGDISHTGADGSDFVTRIKRSGYKFFPRAENLALNYPTLKITLEAWYGSEGHYKNMVLDDLTETGIGHHFCSKGEHWWVQLFGTY